MRVAIIGAGAIGGLLAGTFTRAGADVVLIARGAQLAALKAAGLRVRANGRDEHFALPVADDPAAFGRQDAVVIALKGYSIGPMLPRIAPLLGPDTAVVPAINGIPWWYFERHPRFPQGGRLECLDPDGEMARVLDSRHLVGCVVHAAGEVVEPGVVALTTVAQPYFLGELDGAATPRLAALAASLREGGAQITVTANIRNAIWTKLIGNMSYNPVAALALARMSDINANAGLLRCIRVQMEEAVRVAEFYGETIAMSIDERIAIAHTLGHSKVSMHQDLERGRPMEIDGIVTSVLELARKAGIATPMIDTIHALIAERARHP